MPDFLKFLLYIGLWYVGLWCVARDLSAELWPTIKHLVGRGRKMRTNFDFMKVGGHYMLYETLL